MPEHTTAATSAAIDSTHRRERLLQSLRAIPRLYAELEHCLVVGDHKSERVTRRGAPGIPLNMVAVEVRDDIRAILSSWAGLVAERASVCVPARAVPALAEFLRRHVDCLAEFSAVDDAVDEIADLCAAGQRVLSGATTRRVTIGACIRPRCPGTLIAMIRSPDSPSQSAIVCTVDGTHTWSSEQWHRLRTARPALACGITSGLTASEVATRWRIAPGTVYWLASEHGWRRYRDGRRVYYNLDDVVRTMEQRDAGE